MHEHLRFGHGLEGDTALDDEEVLGSVIDISRQLQKRGPHLSAQTQHAILFLPAEKTRTTARAKHVLYDY